jgi:hypothetical protein
MVRSGENSYFDPERRAVSSTWMTFQPSWSYFCFRCMKAAKTQRFGAGLGPKPVRIRFENASVQQPFFMEPLPLPLSFREPVIFRSFVLLAYPTSCIASPQQSRHPERSASQIYRITKGFMARSRRTSATRPDRCS